MKPKSVQIPYEVYQNLINHLEVHAPTDTWAKTCLEQLEKQSRPSVDANAIAVYNSHKLRSGTYIIDEPGATYKN